jgi:hypothetical protein
MRTAGFHPGSRLVLEAQVWHMIESQSLFKSTTGTGEGEVDCQPQPLPFSKSKTTASTRSSIRLERWESVAGQLHSGEITPKLTTFPRRCAVIPFVSPRGGFCRSSFLGVSTRQRRPDRTTLTPSKVFAGPARVPGPCFSEEPTPTLSAVSRRVLAQLIRPFSKLEPVSGECELIYNRLPA